MLEIWIDLHKCGVWKYFKFDEQARKSICIVKLKSQGQVTKTKTKSTFSMLFYF